MDKILEEQIFEAKKKGLSDQDIGDKYNVNLRYIEKIVTKRLGVNISNPHINKKIKIFQSKNFALETTTVWSFKSRGNWATHNGNYRGNWSPYIPKNVILKFSNESDTVLDCFCGAGTTGVECKLNNRNFIGVDINSKAIELAKENIDFGNYESSLEKKPKIDFRISDARDLSFINDESIDLICTHPPYANIIHYTDNQKEDLSFCEPHKFLNEMNKVSKESYRVLKHNKHCAVLIGDMRKNKHVIPLGFWLIDVYLKNGFILKELVIKRQHNCKTTGFWYNNSIKYNFLLLSHEYLVIFQKTNKEINNNNFKYTQKLPLQDINLNNNIRFENLSDFDTDKISIESTTVWIFNKNTWINKTLSNLIKRYSSKEYYLYNSCTNNQKDLDLIIYFYNTDFDKCINYSKSHLINDGILAIICEDFRLDNGLIIPNGIYIEQKLRNICDFKIKELVVISIENGEKIKNTQDLGITHKYILIYRRDRK